ncbi:hypothetical protein Q1695_003375 [Nippostrongylus brasiliensis]|nr:hypothetical protein Q1695_003375 [Nippostrongylus brasiliensis]
MHLLVILCLNFAVSSAQIDGERTTIFSQDQTSTNKEPQTTMIATEPGDEYYDDDESTGTQTSAVPEDEATEESPEGTSTEEKSDTTVTTDEGMISTTLLPETMEENAGAETENATGMEGTLSTTALSEATETTNPQVTKALEDEGEETTATDEEFDTIIDLNGDDGPMCGQNQPLDWAVGLSSKKKSLFHAKVVTFDSCVSNVRERAVSALTDDGRLNQMLRLRRLPSEHCMQLKTNGLSAQQHTSHNQTTNGSTMRRNMRSML